MIVRHILLGLIGLSLIAAHDARAAVPCRVLKNTERARLIEYVKKKQKLPETMSLRLGAESFVGGTCFRRLEFRSADPKRNFRLELFLSPDFRFLTRELLDSSVDPVVEERRKQQTLAAGLTTGNFPSLGPKDAQVTITVFSDLQCPYCAQAARMLTKEILPAERKTTRVVFRHFPLPNHAWARPAAEAAACAQEQGNDFFWSLHDFLFEHQREIAPENLRKKMEEHVKGLRGFDLRRFQSCVDAKKTAQKVDQDVEFGLRNDINSTPTVFVNYQRLTSVAGPEQIRTLIREMALSEQKTPAAR